MSSASMVDGHIDPDTNRMTDKENYPPLRKVSIAEQYEFYKEITEQEEQKLRNQINRQQEQLDNYSRNVRIMTKTIRENQTLIDELVHTCKKQQAEIDELKHEREVLIEDIHHSADQINEQIEEIENADFTIEQLSKGNLQLQTEIERLKELIDVRHKVFETKCEELETAKSEAIKEFAYELKIKIGFWRLVEDEWLFDIVDNLVKEMVGEDE